MLSRRVVFSALTIICLAGVAQAQDPFQDLGRYLGFGWGDGYHANRTWPINGGANYNYRKAAPQQTLPPPEEMPGVAPQIPEPGSPSDQPVPKTGRRYPTQNGQKRR